MPGPSNGNRKPPRPRIELLYPRNPDGSGRGAEQPAGSGSEAAAIVAALEQFLADTTPVAEAKPVQSAWQRAALEEGVSGRQGFGGSAWGHAPR
jgi:hypothetical protein